MVTDVIVLQHVEPETPGAIQPALERAGVATHVVHIYAGDPVPTTLGDAAGLVLMGGPMGVYDQDRHPHLREELRLIDHALAIDAPVLGICLGSQLLASALGADVRPSGRQEIGWLPIEWAPDAAHDPIVGAAATGAATTGTGALTAFHWHGDVFDLPHGARLLARSAITPLQAFAYRERAYGFLFHLEVDEPLVNAMLRAFGDEVRSAGLDPDHIRSGAATHGPALTTAAIDIFGRWAQLAARTSIP
jgi:GMP synthase (glutamine-hydrolysing)